MVLTMIVTQCNDLGMWTYASLIDAFGGPAKFSEAVGVTRVHAGVMKTRDSIAPEYWPAIVAAARQRRIEGVTAETLMEIAARNAAKRKAAPTPAEDAA